MQPTALLLTTLSLLTTLTTLTTSTPLDLQSRQLGSCREVPCAPGYCCSTSWYCGTGPDYCQLGACTGGVGGTCAAGLCCSPFGFCGTGVEYCGTTTATTTSTTSKTTYTSTSTSTPTSTALVGEWGQCGGEGYTGSTVCVAPYVCTFLSIWWSACR